MQLNYATPYAPIRCRPHIMDFSMSRQANCTFFIRLCNYA